MYRVAHRVQLGLCRSMSAATLLHRSCMSRTRFVLLSAEQMCAWGFSVASKPLRLSTPHLVKLELCYLWTYIIWWVTNDRYVVFFACEFQWDVQLCGWLWAYRQPSQEFQAFRHIRPTSKISLRTNRVELESANSNQYSRNEQVCRLWKVPKILLLLWLI